MKARFESLTKVMISKKRPSLAMECDHAFQLVSEIKETKAIDSDQFKTDAEKKIQEMAVFLQEQKLIDDSQKHPLILKLRYLATLTPGLKSSFAPRLLEMSLKDMRKFISDHHKAGCDKLTIADLDRLLIRRIVRKLIGELIEKSEDPKARRAHLETQLGILKENFSEKSFQILLCYLEHNVIIFDDVSLLNVVTQKINYKGDSSYKGYPSDGIFYGVMEYYGYIQGTLAACGTPKLAVRVNDLAWRPDDLRYAASTGNLEMVKYISSKIEFTAYDILSYVKDKTADELDQVVTALLEGKPNCLRNSKTFQEQARLAAEKCSTLKEAAAFLRVGHVLRKHEVQQEKEASKGARQVGQWNQQDPRVVSTPIQIPGATRQVHSLR